MKYDDNNSYFEIRCARCNDLLDLINNNENTCSVYRIQDYYVRYLTEEWKKEPNYPTTGRIHYFPKKEIPICQKCLFDKN